MGPALLVVVTLLVLVTAGLAHAWFAARRKLIRLSTA
jgi:hypothetical protein